MSLRLLLGIALAIFSGPVMAIEEPKFTLLEKTGPYELRGYEARIVAETIVSGSFKSASSTGFRRIADYIFGNNTSLSGDSKKIGMTAPVSMTPEPEKINMTTPVNMTHTHGNWRIQFFMPRAYTIDSLPKPNNPAVSLRTLPARKFAALRFSGIADELKTEDKISELLKWLEERHISPVGDPILARNVLEKAKLLIGYLMDNDKTFSFDWYEKIHEIDQVLEG